MHDLDPALYVQAYALFAERRAVDQSCALPFVDYGRYVFQPARPFGIRAFFCRAAEDCARQVINEIHGLRSFIQEARIWHGVLLNYPERERFLLTIEFLEVDFIHAMSRPCALRNRFIYSLSMLGTMYKARVGSAQVVRPFERCNFDTMDRLVRDWPGFADFASAHSALNSEAFQERSCGFRDKDHHRMPPNIEVGLTPAARVWTDDGRVCFSNAVQEPIEVEDQVPALEQEYGHACRCLDRFWEMVQQREANWNQVPNQ